MLRKIKDQIKALKQDETYQFFINKMVKPRFRRFNNKIATPLFNAGQKFATETLPAILPGKLGKGLSGLGSAGIGGVVAATCGMTAIQTPITLLVFMAGSSVLAWPAVVGVTLAVGAVTGAAALLGAGMAYGGAKNMGLVSERTGAAPVEQNVGVGAAPADFNPENDFVGASPANSNKRFAVVNTAPEGKTTFGEGLDAKESFTRAKNGTPAVTDQNVPATGAAPAKKHQPKPPRNA